MSANHLVDGNRRNLPSTVPGAADTRTAGQPEPQSTEKERQERRTLRILFALLLIICLYSLGSFSLAPHLLPASFFGAQPSPSSRTTSPAAVGGGACTAAPSDIQYLPANPGPAQSATPLPSTWSQAGFNQEDFTYAQ